MNGPVLSLTDDRLGRPALRLSGAAEIIQPLCGDEPISDQEAARILSQLNGYLAELPSEWNGQSVWDDVIRRMSVSEEPQRAGRYGLSVYGLLAGAAAAGQTVAEWLNGSIKIKPARQEEIWTVAEGGISDELRLLGAVAPLPRARQCWQATAGNQTAGPRGGHHPFFAEDRSTWKTLNAQSAAVAPSAWWCRPTEDDLRPFVIEQAPAVVVDPYPIDQPERWHQLQYELAGRRRATTVWVSDELLMGADISTRQVYGVMWQPHLFDTISDWLAAVNRSREANLQAMLLEPAASHAPWTSELARAVGAEYVWRGAPSQ